MSESPANAHRFARDLRNLQAVCNAFPARWNPCELTIVRIVLSEPMPRTRKSSSAINAFVKRAGFDFGGATTPRVRLFHSTIPHLSVAAQTFDDTPLAVNGKAYLERYLGLQRRADIAREVGRDEHAQRQIQICYHIMDRDKENGIGNEWPGIAEMLETLGGTKIRAWKGIGGLGYGSVAIDHTKAVEIAKHPIIRHVGVVSEMRESS